jgi:uncharacterized integral membrane protein (TIGR00697 family)
MSQTPAAAGHDRPDPTRPPYAMNTQQRVYLWLACFFVTSLIVADIIGVKLFRIPLPFTIPTPRGQVDALVHTCGMLTFPLTFLLTDLINEYYGRRGARRVTYIAFTMAIFAFAVINLALAMPFLDAPYNVSPEAFNAIFSSARIMYVASLAAFLVGSLADIAVFGFLKALTRGKMLWLRATGSTVISQLIDSFIVTYLAFGVGRQLVGGDPPPMPFPEILKTAITGYTLKFVIAIAITPLIYAGHGIMKRWFALEPLPPGSAH